MKADPWDVLLNPIREQRVALCYAAIAGPYPGPCRSAIAAILAHRIVELEDEGEG